MTVPTAADVVCLSHLRWGFVYQRPNHLLARCARTHRVFFVEEPIFHAEKTRIATRSVSPNLNVVVPHSPERPSAAAAEDALRSAVDALPVRFGVRRPVLWFYTPMAYPAVAHVDARAVVYDCMDELSGFLGAPATMAHRERELFARADVVFTGGRSLYESKRAQHPNVHLLPSSVDESHFARGRRGRTGEPADQRSIPRPRLGFFGVIDERMDLDLVAALADAQPDWHVVLLGPVVKIDAGALPRRPNIHYLGQKDYAELPAYIAGWDVALMPFARNPATRFISPTKTLEYLAAGCAVVSTPIRDVVSPYGEAGVVRIGEGQAFVEEVRMALAESRTSAAAARRAAGDAIVARTSWDATWARMASLLEQVDRPLLQAGGARTPCSTT